jgi:hypothetical protein
MAITFDAKTVTKTGSSATITSNTHTCSGSDTILLCGITIRSTRTITVAPTYNGVTMSLAGAASTTSGILNYLYYLVNPTLGSALAISATQSASDSFACATISYNGAAQTLQPNSYSTGGPTTTISYSQAVTTTSSGCQAVLWGNASGGSALTAGTNTTIINQPEVAFTGAFLIASTAVQDGAGSFTLAVTSSSQTFAGSMMAITPSSSKNYLVGRGRNRMVFTGVSQG